MDRRDGKSGLWRSRWAAIGAAVAVTLGAGGLVAVNAATSLESSVVTITPQRILDTRINLGLSGPFQRGTSRKVQVTGNVPTATGVKMVVPAGATGVLLNVTAVCLNRPGVSCAGGWLAVRPGDVSSQTTTSSLNFVAGQVIPNSVQVGLPSKGNIDVVYGPYVPGAQVDVVIDVVGFMSTEVLADIVWALPFAVSEQGTGTVIHATDMDVVSVQLTAPFDGQVTVNTSTSTATSVDGWGTRCAIGIAGAPIEPGYDQLWKRNGAEDVGSLAGTRQFSVQGDVTYKFALRCQSLGTTIPDPSEAVVVAPLITAIYTPAP